MCITRFATTTAQRVTLLLAFRRVLELRDHPYPLPKLNVVAAE
jgi:hypothetical protein